MSECVCVLIFGLFEKCNEISNFITRHTKTIDGQDGHSANADHSAWLAMDKPAGLSIVLSITLHFCLLLLTTPPSHTTHIHTFCIISKHLCVYA